MIPEAIIERKYETLLDSDGRRVKQKDTNRSPNVTDRLEKYIAEHNCSLPEGSTERLLWFSDNLANKQRQKRAKNVIRSKMGTHLNAEWLNGSITFNTCQLEHNRELEKCIEEISNVPVMAVYAQTERSWAIRRLMEDMFSNRRRTYLKKVKANKEQESTEELRNVRQEPVAEKASMPIATWTIAPATEPPVAPVADLYIDPKSDIQKENKEKMTEEEAATAARRAFTTLNTKEYPKRSLVRTIAQSDSEESIENLSDIDGQIEKLKRKRGFLQDRNSHTGNARTHEEGALSVSKRQKISVNKNSAKKPARKR